MADPGRSQTAGDPAGPIVNLGPGVPHRLVRFAGDHALGAGSGTVEHLLGESAHGDLLRVRCGVNGANPVSMLRLPGPDA
jgi:hypothetical protein